MLTGFIIYCYIITISAGLRWVFRELKGEIGNPFDNIRRLRERYREQGSEKNKE